MLGAPPTTEIRFDHMGILEGKPRLLLGLLLVASVDRLPLGPNDRDSLIGPFVGVCGVSGMMPVTIGVPGSLVTTGLALAGASCIGTVLRMLGLLGLFLLPLVGHP